ncbi:hypothetical protein L6452_33851 [Arctium lappa]|uniref:Uncharacterized protein n=1 Tax=Arctium lappa TaxID=4217 RepID=A0ACB8YH81_ARCLA|nr:hypothetical protein L6452_33851 [Arctium lappa]
MASKTYEELHGSNNWDGLLDPLNPDLRTLILAYGDLCSAAERALNNDEGSKYAGYSRYGKSSFFQGVMLPWAESKYTITSFIYTTTHVDYPLSFLVHQMSRKNSEFESNWMGYVAVSNDEFSNPNSDLVKTSARTQLLTQIKELLVKYKDEKISITCTGHSLGASLATISAFDLAANVANPDIKVSAFGFASPQVGNQAFKEKMEELPNLKIISIKNVNDIIPKWPSKIMEWVDDKTNLVNLPKDVMLYVDVGIEILIDNKRSPYLIKETGHGLDILQVLEFHNLEGMLHIVAGYDWKSVLKKLVNMSVDLLKEKYQKAQSWWTEKNKRKVLNDSGDWVSNRS